MDNKNKIIEDAIKAFISNRTEEQLAVALTVLRENLDNELVVSVMQSENGLEVKPVRTSDGKLWFMAFTSLEEQARGKSKVQSMFSSSLGKIFAFTLDNADASGVIINPYGSAMFLDKTIIKVVLGKKSYGLS